MVNVENPWLIWGCHGLIILTRFLFCNKIIINFHKGIFRLNLFIRLKLATVANEQ